MYEKLSDFEGRCRGNILLCTERLDNHRYHLLRNRREAINTPEARTNTSHKLPQL